MACPCCVCECPEWCLYRIEILAPVQWGPKPQYPCSPSTNASTTLFYANDGVFPPCEDSSLCCGSISTPQGFGTSIGVYADNKQAQVLYTSKYAARATANIGLRCSSVNGRGVVYLDAGLLFVIPGDIGLTQSFPRRRLEKKATATLSTQCISLENASCQSSAAFKFSAIDTPIEFSISAQSAGIVAWNESLTTDIASGPQDRCTPCYTHLLDNFSATFRITSRTSCNAFP